MRHYVPFSNEEFQRAREFLEAQRFKKISDEWYANSEGNVWFWDNDVGEQVEISGKLEKSNVLKKLVEILQPGFFLDGAVNKHSIAGYFSNI